MVLATANPHKVLEIREILPEFDFIDRPTDVPDVVEDGETLEENARLKAVALVEATGKPSVADDTGLWVDALGGKPGIHAARYAGENATYEHNVNKMLWKLKEVPLAERTARFKTIALLRYPDGREVIAEGVIEGHIAEAKSGEGMGYDPIFIPDDGDGSTFADMGEDLKNEISHRGKAFRALRDQLVD